MGKKRESTGNSAGQRMPESVTHYVMDAGSIPRRSFAWLSSAEPDRPSNVLPSLAEAMASDLAAGRGVTLGCECPLVWPCPEGPDSLGKQRRGEDGRPWSAGAGAAVTPTGCQALAWVLRHLAKEVPDAGGTTRWQEFADGLAELFLWEAFGSNKPRQITHAEDVRHILSTFHRWLADPHSVRQITTDHAISLAAALLLWAGLSDDIGLLREPCLALKVDYDRPPSPG